MTDQTETPDLAELRRLLDDVRALATREGIYNGNRAVLDIIGRVEPLLDAAAERVALGRRGDTLARDLGAAVVRADRAESERDALAAKVERVRALPAKHPAGGWYMTSMRDVLAALDEEPQP